MTDPTTTTTPAGPPSVPAGATTGGRPSHVAAGEGPDAAVAAHERRPAVNSDAILRDLDRVIGERNAARAAEAELRAKLAMACGSCHPCMNWSAEVLRRPLEALVKAADEGLFGTDSDGGSFCSPDVYPLIEAARTALAPVDMDALAALLEGEDES